MLSERGKTILSKSIRLLSSDNDGEVIAAVGAMRRTLQKEGLSFHELADMATGGTVPAKPTSRSGKVRTERHTQLLQKLLATCLQRDLYPNEEDFVLGVLDRIGKDQAFVPSEKQMAWLNKIATRGSRR